MQLKWNNLLLRKVWWNCDKLKQYFPQKNPMRWIKKRNLVSMRGVCVCAKGEGPGLLVKGGNELQEVSLECRNGCWITYSATPTKTTHTNTPTERDVKSTVCTYLCVHMHSTFLTTPVTYHVLVKHQFYLTFGGMKQVSSDGGSSDRWVTKCFPFWFLNHTRPLLFTL